MIPSVTKSFKNMLVNDEFSFITNNYFPNTIKWEKEERGNKFPFLAW